MKTPHFDERFKKELCEELFRRLQENELAIRKKLEEAGVDTSKTIIIDRAKFLVKFMPDVLEEMFEKYGPSKVFTDEVKEEALKLVQTRFHEDLAKQPVKLWNIYYLLLHCKIYKPITLLDNVTLIPFDGWPCNDYLEIIERLFQNLGPKASRLSEENLKAAEKYFSKIYPEKNPLSLLIFRDVKADTELEACEKTRNYADSVVLCMSNLTNASIEIRGWLTEGKLEGINVIHPTINFPQYKPTYIEPEALEKVARIILDNVNNNGLLELALSCERDALSDDQKKFSILKRWSALEFIAEEKSNSDENSNSDKKLLTKTDVAAITEFVKKFLAKNNVQISPAIERRVHNYISQINHKEAKEKVRDLLKWANHPIKKNDNSENDIIDVIYQHRNCIVHLGGCSKSDKTIKDCDGPVYCKKSLMGQAEVNRELSRILTGIIGRFVGAKFEFNDKIPDNIEKT